MWQFSVKVEEKPTKESPVPLFPSERIGNSQATREPRALSRARFQHMEQSCGHDGCLCDLVETSSKICHRPNTTCDDGDSQ